MDIKRISLTVLALADAATVIAPAGWYTNPSPNPAVATVTSGWKEYGSVTPSGTPVTGHNSCGKILTAEEAQYYM